MSTEVTLPALGESVTEGTVSRWLKQVGDTVEADEALLEVSTDKVDTEIPSPTAGTLLEIKVDEDETVEVGAVLAVIGDADESGSDSGSDESSEEADEDSSEDTSDEDTSEGASTEAPSETSEDEGAEAQAEQDARQNTDPVTEGGSEESDQAPEQSSDEKSSNEKSSGGAASGTEVTLPELGESVTEGTVSRWLKQVGDTVEADEALLEVSTDKVDTEIPSPTAGTLLEIRAKEDETVEVGAVLAVIGDADAATGSDDADDSDQTAGDSGQGEEISDQSEAGDEGGQEPIPTPTEEKKPEPKKAPEPKKEPEPKKAAPKAESAPKAAPRATGGEDTYVTPLVRKLAAEHDVDLGALTGTGVGGRIRKQDVLAAAEEAKKAAAAPAAAAPAAEAAPAAASEDAKKLRGTTEKLSRLRKTIAHRMVESLQVSAQLTATVEVDLTRISRLRKQYKEEFQRSEGAKLSYLPFITKAAVEALKTFPKVNAQVDTEAGEITYADAEHVGIAVDTEKGLIVPVIRDAGDLNLAGLAKKIGDLAERTRTNKLSPDDLAGGTFTITNYGSAGTLMDTPIINQPQVAILGTGALVKRPVVISDDNLGDTIVIRDMMYVSMTYDHRIVDGADAARFLSTLKARLEGGDFEGELGH